MTEHRWEMGDHWTRRGRLPLVLGRATSNGRTSKSPGSRRVPFAPPWVVVAAVGSIAAILGALTLLRTGTAAGVLVLVGGLLLQILFLRGWFITTARTNRYLVGRQDLGDWVRLAMIASAFVAVPIGGVLIAGAILALAQAL